MLMHDTTAFHAPHKTEDDGFLVAEVPHAQRGSFVNVGCPIKLSDSPVEVTASPLLGEPPTVLCLRPVALRSWSAAAGRPSA